MEELCRMSPFWESGSQRKQYFCLRRWVLKKQMNGSRQGLADGRCLWQGVRPIAMRPAVRQLAVEAAVWWGLGLKCSSRGPFSTSTSAPELVKCSWHAGHRHLTLYPAPFLFTSFSLKCFFFACLCPYYRFILVINAEEDFFRNDSLGTLHSHHTRSPERRTAFAASLQNH